MDSERLSVIGEAERTERREAEGDDLNDRDEVGLIADAIGVHRPERGHAGVVDVAAADGEEHRREESDDEVQQDVGGVEKVIQAGCGFLAWFGKGVGFGHAARLLLVCRGFYLRLRVYDLVPKPGLEPVLRGRVEVGHGASGVSAPISGEIVTGYPSGLEVRSGSGAGLRRPSSDNFDSVGARGTRS
jgi:hypothetical protein